MTMKLPPGVSLPGIDPGGVISTIEPASAAEAGDGIIDNDDDEESTA